MSHSIMLDTSFLITLTDSSRSQHAVAKSYYQYFIENKCVMYLSVIVIAEFCQKQPITDLPLDNFIIVPFNFDDSIQAASFGAELKDTKADGQDRSEFKDDIKLLAQAALKSADFVVTEDESTLQKYCARLNGKKKIKAATIVLKDGFDKSHFNNGQHELPLN